LADRAREDIVAARRYERDDSSRSHWFAVDENAIANRKTEAK